MAAQTVDLRKLIPKYRNFLEGNDRNLSNLGLAVGAIRCRVERFRKDDDSSDDSDFDSDNEEVIKRRVALNALEDECDFAQQVESIRYELSKKKEERKKNEEDEASILSDKRYAKSNIWECGVSPFTVQALSAAGYV
ncbi:hypothetical protein M0R45_024721 [Rubus argutus]|uniref:Uncharacterized protein n=1 Tax=Rubus argutus TaxID=59490 RepID=A0AAW1WW64_RUBAR